MRYLPQAVSHRRQHRMRLEIHFRGKRIRLTLRQSSRVCAACEHRLYGNMIRGRRRNVSFQPLCVVNLGALKVGSECNNFLSTRGDVHSICRKTNTRRRVMTEYELVLSAASQLSVTDRLRLIDDLAASAPDDQPPTLSEAWLAEVERRSAEIDAGTVTPEPWPGPGYWRERA